MLTLLVGPAGSVLVKQGELWVPARAVEILQTFRRCFCPDVDWGAFEVLSLVLDRIWRGRESQKVDKVEQRYGQKIEKLQRQSNQTESMLLVQQTQKIAALRKQLRASGGRRRQVSKAGTALEGTKKWDVRRMAEKNLDLAMKVDALEAENVNLRDILQKSSAAVDNVIAVHREGAAAQNRQIRRCLGRAKDTAQEQVAEARNTMKKLASAGLVSPEVTDGIGHAMSSLSRGISSTLEACENQATEYSPPALGQ